MLGEIYRDLFCSGYHYKDGWCLLGDCVHVDSCKRCHHKWPTPEQFREEYGKEVPDDFPVWLNAWYENGKSMYASGEYKLMEYVLAKSFTELVNDSIKRWAIVCVCTPVFGKPPDDWRPE